MSIVKDQNLAPAGRRKINWVRDFMPALGGIEARFEQEQPFAGLRVAVSVHLEAKTANLGYVLAKGGATWPPDWPTWAWRLSASTAPWGRSMRTSSSRPSSSSPT